MLAELIRDSLAILILGQLASQLLNELLRLLMDGQERNRLDIQQPRRHLKEFTGDLQILLLHLTDIVEILLDYLHYRHVVDAQLLFTDKLEQEIHRPLKDLELILYFFQIQTSGLFYKTER